jgi:hypothetical protein
MANHKIARRSCAVLLMAVLAIVAAASARPRRHRAHPPRAVRLYVFDCGVIKGLDPALFNFKKEELATTEFAVPCKKTGTQLWIEHDFTANSKLKKAPTYYD